MIQRIPKIPHPELIVIFIALLILSDTMLCKGYLGSLFPHLFKLFVKQPSDFNVIDPYEIPISEFKENIENWSDVHHDDIVNCSFWS